MLKKRTAIFVGSGAILLIVIALTMVFTSDVVDDKTETRQETSWISGESEHITERSEQVGSHQELIEEVEILIKERESPQKIQDFIQNGVEKNNLKPFSSVVIDIRDEFEYGEKITFTLVNFGYRDWCLFPQIRVYEQGETLPIYEGVVFQKCAPPSEKPYPRVSIYHEYDFNQFPNCTNEGRFTIEIEAFEFGPKKIASFECKTEKQESIPVKPVRTDQKLNELYFYALELVNRDRVKHGVSQVKLGVNNAAQVHAYDMLQNNFYSHWYSDNVKPYVVYTKLGGRGSVGENIATTHSSCPSNNCFPNVYDPKKEIDGHQYGMMYDDAESDWGHRDNIIDPHHTTVNFGIAYDDEDFYFVQHFETSIIRWKNAAMLTNSIIGLNGEIPDGYSVSNISIYEDPEPKKLDSNTLMNQAPYNIGFYDQGNLVGMLVPPLGANILYQECSPKMIKAFDESGNMSCIPYGIYTESGSQENRISISADVSEWLKRDGLHTLYILLLDEKTGESFPATSITLEYLN